MERLTEDEMVAVLVTLRQRAEECERRAEILGMNVAPALTEWCLRQARLARSAYAKLIDWPYEPECGTL